MEDATPEEMAEVMGAWQAYTDELRDSGAFIAGEGLVGVLIALMLGYQKWQPEGAFGSFLSSIHFADHSLHRIGGLPGALLGILQAVQERNPRKYLCAADLEYIAAGTVVPLSQLFSVVTFSGLTINRTAVPSAVNSGFEA